MKTYDNILETPGNIFLTGKAGTGKSTLIRDYIEKHPNTAICAPTGIAAVNVGGETMHRLFAIPIPSLGASLSKITNSKIASLIEADTVIIDEISMCRNDTFSFAIKVLRKAERIKGKKKKLIVCGDFSQLPPVVRKEDKKLLKKFGFDESGFPFTTSEWKTMNFKCINLEKVYRQDNPQYLENLEKARRGDLSCLDYFNSFVDEHPDDKNSIYICGTNAEADRLNKEYLDSLPGNAVAYQSTCTGRTTKGIVDDIILLKEGARVIFTVNDVSNNRYQNGTMGIVKTLKPDYVQVDVDGHTVNISKYTYRFYSHNVVGNTLVRKEIGTIEQMPLRVAKAITIHKSQGQTFDNVILSPQIFASGQLYVALSRVRDPKGLKILQPLSADGFNIDPVVEKFYNNGYTYDVVKKKATVTKTVTKKATTKPATKKTTAKRSSPAKGKAKATKKSTKRTTKPAAKKPVSHKKTTKRRTVKK